MKSVISVTVEVCIAFPDFQKVLNRPFPNSILFQILSFRLHLKKYSFVIYPQQIKPANL